MGGDGGVIASNRRYMRGAGTSEVSDAKTVDPRSARDDTMKMMRYCALTNQPLPFGKAAIVACPYGWLYIKEQAIESLLRRKRQQAPIYELGSHIRGLKDLHDVRFHLVASDRAGAIGEDNHGDNDGVLLPTCPITGRELNGIIPAFALVPGKPDQINVVSEHGFNEMGIAAVSAEYGPIEKKIRLAPPPAVWNDVQKALEEQRAKEKESSSSSRSKKRAEQEQGKDHKKRKRCAVENPSTSTERRPTSKSTHSNELSSAARAKVSEAVRKNEVLSSLFRSSDATSNASTGNL